jgi:16S rRNA A1518/A1519 N6-dimethyltransferase RsmA/KsgA/DIM1 with predicted DNA glycosylase/AP lyase activity
MVKIRQLYRDFIIKLQEAALTFGAGKRIQIMLEYIDIRPSDTLLDVGGNTGKITEAYARNCKEVVVLEPKHNVVEYGREGVPKSSLQ